MLPILFSLILMIGTVAAVAQAPVKVSKVKFDTTKDDWIQMEVELDFRNNTLADARDKDFFDYIGVKVYLAYELDATQRLYDYYCSEVKIAMVEANEKYNVYFYLPGMIVKRDEIPQPRPAYHYVALDIAGNELAPSQGSPAISHSIKNLQILNSFIAKANEMRASTAGMLIPSYFVPSAYKSRVKKQPLYLRLDPDPTK